MQSSDHDGSLGSAHPNLIVTKEGPPKNSGTGTPSAMPLGEKAFDILGEVHKTILKAVS